MVKLRDTADAAPRPEKLERLVCVDALRGLFLILLISGGFGLASPRQEMLSQERWGWLLHQFQHRDWQGFSLWDMLLPAFLFCAGVAMPISYANRQAQRQSWFRQFARALFRAGFYVLLGIYLESYQQGRLLFDLRGVLPMIGLATLLAFLVLPLGLAAQGVTVGFLLVGTIAAYVIYAFAAGHELWAMNHNAGLALDQWLGFPPHPRHLVTLNLLPWTAIVLIGALVGGLIRADLTAGAKVAVLTAASLLALVLGWVLGGGDGWIDFSWYALIPIIRPIASLTFVLSAVGWTMLIFTYFYLLTDGFGLRAWALPLTVPGRNLLVLYVAYDLFHDWAERSARLVLPSGVLTPLWTALIVLAIYWLFSFWLYRRKILLKV